MSERLIVADAVVTDVGSIGNAILISDGKVVAIGDRDEFARKVDHEYPGGFITPGFRDAHIHAIPYAALLSGCSLKNATSLHDLIERLKSYAASISGSRAIVASRMDDEGLAEQRLPTRFDLDRVSSNLPVVVYRYCGHIAVANTVALERSGIDTSTADPEGGSLDRDADGVPNGILRETAAGLLGSALSRGGTMDRSTFIDGMTRLAGLGITSIGAMIGYGEQPHEQLDAESQLLHDCADDLPLRIGALSITNSPQTLASSQQVIDAAPGTRLRWLGVKRFADGSLGGHTAAMCEPFDDRNTIGTMRLSEADVEVSRASLALGGMVAIHAIGDRAISAVLDTFDRLIADGADPADLRMEHVSIASPELLDRFGETGILAVVQPAFLASESEWLPKRLGSERLVWAYPFRSMMDRGITVAGSSDSIVEPPHPLWGMQAAMDRYGIAPHEHVGGIGALSMFTSHAARALREPTPLAPGSPADLAVIDANPCTATSAEVGGATVLDTYVDGKVVDVDRSLPTWTD